MVPGGNARWRLWLAVALLLATAAAQGAQYIPGWHHHDGASHCCCACQIGRLSAAPPAVRTWLDPVTAVAWRLAAEQAADSRDPDLRTTSSRAPPA